jgi:putative ABC transport system ATP-binding protein
MPAEVSPLIEFKQVSKIYGSGFATIHALQDVNLQINQGEFVAVMGSSGSGKSTGMNIIGCLDTPSSGQYFFKNAAVGSFNRKQRSLLRRHYLGFIFQGFNLLQRTSAIENVELPLVYRRIDSKKRQRLAGQALESVGLGGRESYTSSELSGGQQQRVAVARAIVTRPTLLLADEPTGNLDTATSIEIMELLAALNKDQNITIVMVTHEPDMATYADRIIQFRDGHVLTVE